MRLWATGRRRQDDSLHSPNTSRKAYDTPQRQETRNILDLWPSSKVFVQCFPRLLQFPDALCSFVHRSGQAAGKVSTPPSFSTSESHPCTRCPMDDHPFASWILHRYLIHVLPSKACLPSNFHFSTLSILAQLNYPLRRHTTVLDSPFSLSVFPDQPSVSRGGEPAVPPKPEMCRELPRLRTCDVDLSILRPHRDRTVVVQRPRPILGGTALVAWILLQPPMVGRAGDLRPPGTTSSGSTRGASA